MKERPILFSTSMVQAILAGRKTQTRRIVKPQPTWKERDGLLSPGWSWVTPKRELNAYPKDKEFAQALVESCPYGQPGDCLWVRETWKWANGGASGFRYRADGELKGPGKWKPSIHMPRTASRITIEITAVRVERLHSITAEDAIAEGILKLKGYEFDAPAEYENYLPVGYTNLLPIGSYRSLWESINGTESWRVNPWVWVVEFKTVSR